MTLVDAEMAVFQGMKRSGNHALIDWIIDNVKGVRHYNNIFPVAKELRAPGTFTFPIDLARARRSKKNHRFGLADFLIGRRRVPIISVEDFPFSRNFVTCDGRAIYILLVRSAENVFASRIHKAFARDMIAYPREMNDVMRRSIELWADHVENFLDASERDDFVGIVFDDWVSNDGYRRMIAAKMGFHEAVPPRRSRAAEGLGSSFDGYAPVADGAQALLRRRERLDGAKLELLNKVLSDAAIVNATRRLNLHRSTRGVHRYQ